MTPNVVNPFSAEMARRQQEAGAAQAQAMQHYGHAQANPLLLQRGQQQLNTPPQRSHEEVLDEILREVRSIAKRIDATQAVVTKMLQALPANALRHGTPR